MKPGPIPRWRTQTTYSAECETCRSILASGRGNRAALTARSHFLTTGHPVRINAEYAIRIGESKPAARKAS